MIFPFGKYKDKDYSELLNDKKYLVKIIIFINIENIIIYNILYKYNIEDDRYNNILSSSINNSLNKKKKTRNKLTKAQQFREERNKIVSELENLIGITENNRGVLLYDLEKNDKLKEYLRVIVPNIKKYYKCGNWNYFIQKEENRDVIWLLKSIFKNEIFQLINKQKFLNIDGIKKQYTQIYIICDKNIKNLFN